MISYYICIVHTHGVDFIQSSCSNYLSTLKVAILYSVNFWWWKTLVNLVNHWWVTKFYHPNFNYVSWHKQKADKQDFAKVLLAKSFYGKFTKVFFCQTLLLYSIFMSIIELFLFEKSGNHLIKYLQYIFYDRASLNLICIHVWI